jgi:hypothetical protein
MDEIELLKPSVRVAPEIGTKINGASIRQLRLHLGESLSKFGLTLKRAIDPKATKGYSRQYISKLEQGNDPKFTITPEIESAFYVISQALDGVPAGTGGTITVQVHALPGQVQEGAYVKPSLRTKSCARPGCSVVFIGLGIYHNTECQRAWAKERRKIKSR